MKRKKRIYVQTEYGLKPVEYVMRLCYDTLVINDLLSISLFTLHLFCFCLFPLASKKRFHTMWKETWTSCEETKRGSRKNKSKSNSVSAQAVFCLSSSHRRMQFLYSAKHEKGFLRKTCL